jgi:hypothetical protein
MRDGARDTILRLEWVDLAKRYKNFQFLSLAKFFSTICVVTVFKICIFLKKKKKQKICLEDCEGCFCNSATWRAEGDHNVDLNLEKG